MGFEGGTIQYSLLDVLTIVFKRRLLILVVLFTVVTVVMCGSLVAPIP